MSNAPTPSYRAGKLVSMAIVIGISSALTGCGSAGPPPVTYVLGPPPPITTSTEPLIGRPVIELKRVTVPDYLDVSDIMVRQSANVLAPSPTGRWGERLSVGVTRALAFDLSIRLPHFIVTTTPGDGSAFEILVEIEDFAPRADGTVVLLARWRLLGETAHRTLAGERVSLADRAAGSDDAAIAAAMTREVDDLAARVAAGIQHASSRFRPTGQSVALPKKQNVKGSTVSSWGPSIRNLRLKPLQYRAVGAIGKWDPLRAARISLVALAGFL